MFIFQYFLPLALSGDARLAQILRRMSTAKGTILALVNGFVETEIVFVDEYGSEKIRATRRAGPYQIPDVREVYVALRQRALQPDFVPSGAW